MMRIRKNGDIWEVRRMIRDGILVWDKCESLESLQQKIIGTAVNLDYYARFALEVIQGSSDTYLYQDRELIRRTPIGHHVSCLTPYLQTRSNLETIIRLIASGIWRVREWKTPACLANFPEDIWRPEKNVKESYLILETCVDKFMPSDFQKLFYSYYQD